MLFSVVTATFYDLSSEHKSSIFSISLLLLKNKNKSPAHLCELRQNFFVVFSCVSLINVVEHILIWLLIFVIIG